MKSFNASFEAGIAENRHNMLKRRSIKMIFFANNRFPFPQIYRVVVTKQH